MTERPNLYDLTPLRRFDGRSRTYAKFRPSYPPEAIDAILDGLADPDGLRTVDIGAGTGISARLLADRGVRVDAIEPNDDMRLAAEPHARVTWHGSTGESTGLAGETFDLIVCAQSFHWLEPRAALTEFRRLLVPRGRLALIWNDRDTSSGPMTAYDEIIREASGGDASVDRSDSHAPLQASALFSCDPVREFGYEQRLDEDGLIGRAASSSYIPTGGERRETMERRLRELHRAHRASDGLIGLAYRTALYTATPVA